MSDDSTVGSPYEPVLQSESWSRLGPYGLWLVALGQFYDQAVLSLRGDVSRFVMIDNRAIAQLQTWVEDGEQFDLNDPQPSIIINVKNEIGSGIYRQTPDEIIETLIAHVPANSDAAQTTVISFAAIEETAMGEAADPGDGSLVYSFEPADWSPPEGWQ